MSTVEPETDNATNTPTRPPCAECGQPSSCFGQYDIAPEPTFACDECCGHGCEDGTCVQFAEDRDVIQALRSARRIIIQRLRVASYFADQGRGGAAEMAIASLVLRGRARYLGRGLHRRVTVARWGDFPGEAG
jgi:hypothetical protein